MKIKILTQTILLLILMNSCATSTENYEGYIYERKDVPAKNFSICEENINNCTETDNTGFFKLKKNKTIINNLIVIYKNKPIDTLKIVWAQHGEKINYSFLEGKKATLYLHKK